MKNAELDFDPTKVSPSEDQGNQQVPFDESLLVSTGEFFKFELSANNNSYGFIGVTEKGWCILGVDAQNAGQFSTHTYKTKDYFKIVNQGEEGKYLSVRKRGGSAHPVGIYNWGSAVSWSYTEGGHMTWDGDEKYPLSFYDTAKGYLYVNDGKNYTKLNVTKVLIKQPA